MVRLRSGYETNPAERWAQVFVRIFLPGAKTIHVPLSTTGHDVKLLLIAEYGLHAWRCDRLGLIHNGHTLYDWETLYEHGAANNSTIHVMGRFGDDRFCEICRIPPRPSENRPCCIAHGQLN